MKFVFNKDAVDAYRLHLKAQFNSGAMGFNEYAREAGRVVDIILKHTLDIQLSDC